MEGMGDRRENKFNTRRKDADVQAKAACHGPPQKNSYDVPVKAGHLVVHAQTPGRHYMADMSGGAVQQHAHDEAVPQPPYTAHACGTEDARDDQGHEDRRDQR